MTRRTALISAALLLALPAQAEEFHLSDGSVLQGAYVGESDGTITVLTRNGSQELPRASVTRIDWTHKVPDSLRKKAERARAKLLSKQQKQVRKLVKAYGKSKDAAERDALEAKIAALEAEALVEPLDDALRSRKAPVRALAVRRLGALGSTRAVGPLVKAALTTKDRQLASDAHAAAVKVDASLARRFYETVAATQTKPGRRLRALANVKAMKDRAAVPGLVRVLEHVRSEVRATLAKGDIRRVPVNLGSRGAAATNVPIELPEANLTEVKTTVSVPVTVLQQIERAAVDALKGVSGQDFGDDPGAWKRWWDRQPRAKTTGSVD